MVSWGGLFERVPTSFKMIVSVILVKSSVLSNMQVRTITGEVYSPLLCDRYPRDLKCLSV